MPSDLFHTQLTAFLAVGFWLLGEALAQSVLLPSTFQPTPSSVYALQTTLSSRDTFLSNAVKYGKKVFADSGQCSDEGEFIFWDRPTKNAVQFAVSILKQLQRQGFRFTTISKNEEPGYRAGWIIRITNAQKPILATVTSYQTDLPIEVFGRTRGYSSVLWCYAK